MLPGVVLAPTTATDLGKKKGSSERVTTAAGKVSLAKEEVTTAVWGGPVKHREENLSDTAMETLVIELKN